MPGNWRALAASPVLPVRVASLAPHANLATCLLLGRGGPVGISSGGPEIMGEAILVQPLVRHAISLPPGGADVVYLTGIAFPSCSALARVLSRSDGARLRRAAEDGAAPVSHWAAMVGLACGEADPSIDDVIRQILTDPMDRMSQTELARHLGMERTRALRRFRAATGHTFREFKRWQALLCAARNLRDGAPVRDAALDAGFADTSHLSRLFKATFGVTASAASAALSHGARAASPA